MPITIDLFNPAHMFLTCAFILAIYGFGIMLGANEDHAFPNIVGVLLFLVLVPGLLVGIIGMIQHQL